MTANQHSNLPEVSLHSLKPVLDHTHIRYNYKDFVLFRLVVSKVIIDIDDGK